MSRVDSLTWWISNKGKSILDSVPSSSFISERLVQTLYLPRSTKSVNVTGIAGPSLHAQAQSVASVRTTAMYGNNPKQFDFTAIVLPKVTCDLSVVPVPFHSLQTHLSLADSSFGLPGRINLLLGIDIFNTLCQGWWISLPGAPVAIETDFGWVSATVEIITHVVSLDFSLSTWYCIRLKIHLTDQYQQKNKKLFIISILSTIVRTMDLLLYPFLECWAVFDASIKSAMGVSLNDTLLVGPTIYSALFSIFTVALTADIIVLSSLWKRIDIFTTLFGGLPQVKLQTIVWLGSHLVWPLPLSLPICRLSKTHLISLILSISILCIRGSYSGGSSTSTTWVVWTVSKRGISTSEVEFQWPLHSTVCSSWIVKKYQYLHENVRSWVEYNHRQYHHTWILNGRLYFKHS